MFRRGASSLTATTTRYWSNNNNNNTLSSKRRLLLSLYNHGYCPNTCCIRSISILGWHPTSSSYHHQTRHVSILPNNLKRTRMESNSVVLLPSNLNHRIRQQLPNYNSNNVVTKPFQSRQQRWYTSSTVLRIPNRGSDAFKEMYGVPYSISPEEALTKFETWARNEQGLGRFLLNWDNVRISAVYTPVWCFTINIRFILNEPTGADKKVRKRLDWKPDVFQEAYGTNQTVVHLPGLSAYAGHNYRRSLIDPLHNLTLVFINQDVVPFGGWMMRDMKLSNGDTLPVSPDAWNASRGQAFSIVKQNLQSLGNAAANLPSSEHTVTVQTELVSYRRVYMPTYVIDYTVWSNLQFQAYVSGCDAAADVSGVSHKVFSDTSILNNPNQLTSSILNTASSAAATGSALGRRFGLGPRELGAIFIIFVQFVGGLFVRFISRIPLIGFVVGVTIGFRKIIQPWMDHRYASVEWERQRQREAAMNIDSMDDFTDTGTARRYYDANRERILHTLSGGNEKAHNRGTYDWYQEWEKWARQQWEEQQQQQQNQQNNYNQQQQQQYNQQQQRRTSTTSPRSKKEYQWDFDPNDPYSVLGIKRGANKQEISAAFRKQMMTYHPDLQANASEAEKDRAIERSKLITDAYRKLKSNL